MTNHTCSFRALILAILLVIGAAEANNINTGGQKGALRTTSAYALGKGSINTGLSIKGDVAYRNLTVQGSEETAILISENLFFGYGVTNWMDLSLDIPVYQDIWEGHTENASGFGDIQAGIKLMHPGLLPNAPLRVSYLLRTTIPTGSDDYGYFPRHSYYTSNRYPEVNDPYSSGGLSLNPMMVWTLDMTKLKESRPVLMDLNLGVTAMVLNQNENNYPQDNSALVGNFALSYLASEQLTLLMDIYGESRFVHYLNDGITLEKFFRNINNDQVYLSLGARYTDAKGMYYGLAADISLSDRNYKTQWEITDDDGRPFTYETSPAPTIGLTATVGFSKLGAESDPDYDYIPTVDDSCPYEAEDYDGYEDEDGCLDKVHETDTVIITETDTVMVIKKDTVRITQEAEQILTYNVITLPSVNFKAGSAELTAGSSRMLNEVAAVLKEHPDIRMEIRGYTDITGKKELNQRLSKERALAVGMYLVRQGIEKKRLRPVGMGEADPIADNDSPMGRVLNRRVELKRIQ
ncbi:MAG: OmpA family protein [Fibrobacterota bacterium]